MEPKNSHKTPRTDNVETKIYNPPYIGVASLSNLFKLISTRSFSSITVDDLTTRGFSKSVAFQSLQALRFLGLIDETGKTTQKIRTLSLKGEDRKVGLAKILKDSYSNLFNVVENPNLLTRDELHNEFVAIYDLSNRLASTAVPAFLWLCTESGMEVTDFTLPTLSSVQSEDKVKSKIMDKPKLSQTIKNSDTSLDSTVDIKKEGSNTFILKNTGAVLLLPLNIATQWAISGKLGKILLDLDTDSNHAEVAEQVDAPAFGADESGDS